MTPQASAPGHPAPRLFGLLITKDDHEIFADWCRDQLPLYDAVVCLDGSESGETARQAADFAGRLVYLHERDFDIAHKTDHGLRRVAHNEIVRRFGHGHWVMCCHADEFCYHDPRTIAALAGRLGCDQVSWFSPHFYPHPDELPDWPRLRGLPVPHRHRHYHWDRDGSGLPWAEDRLYLAGPGVGWDDRTHGSVRPHGLSRPAPFRPALRHYKVVAADPSWYERSASCAHYLHHWQGLGDRTGLPFPVRRFEDLFVRSVRGYGRCDRFGGRFDHPWNLGEEFRPGAPDGAAQFEAERRRRSVGEQAARGERE